MHSLRPVNCTIQVHPLIKDPEHHRDLFLIVFYSSTITRIKTMAQPTIKVIGKIKIPEPKKKMVCSCDKCGRRVDDRFGDPRIIIYSSNKSVIKQVCEECAKED